MLRKFLIALMSFSILLSADDCCYDCGNNVWFGAEYLYWRIKEGPKVIPLIVEGPVVEDFGPTFGQPGTSVLLGNKEINHSWRSGGRFTLGYWLNDDHCLGVEANYLFLGESKYKKSIFSEGFITFPFIDSTTGQESSIAVAVPDSFTGTASLKVSNDLQGAELNGLMFYGCFNNWDINLIGGFRYLNFSEKLNFNTSSPFIDPTIVNVYFTRDKFHMDNNFYGAQIGANIGFNYCNLLCNIRAKIAFGANCQSSKIKGEFFLNDFTDFTTVQEFEGGYLALPSSIGHRKKTKFSVVPEVNINVGYKITETIAVTVAYDFLYLTNVLRAAKQLSREINPTQSALFSYTPNPVLVGEAEPTGRLRSTRLWVQGVNVGLEFVY